jgi:acyl-coenzyme A thioesterase PaaI-like protein
VSEPFVQESPAARTLTKATLAEDREHFRVSASFEADDRFLNRTGHVFGGFIAAMLENLCGLLAKASATFKVAFETEGNV